MLQEYVDQKLKEGEGDKREIERIATRRKTTTRKTRTRKRTRRRT